MANRAVGFDGRMGEAESLREVMDRFAVQLLPLLHHDRQAATPAVDPGPGAAPPPAGSPLTADPAGPPQGSFLHDGERLELLLMMLTGEKRNESLI